MISYILKIKVCLLYSSTIEVTLSIKSERTEGHSKNTPANNLTDRCDETLQLQFQHVVYENRSVMSLQDKNVPPLTLTNRRK